MPRRTEPEKPPRPACLFVRRTCCFRLRAHSTIPMPVLGTAAPDTMLRIGDAREGKPANIVLQSRMLTAAPMLLGAHRRLRAVRAAGR